jgi:hypothetical protein
MEVQYLTPQILAPKNTQTHKHKHKHTHTHTHTNTQTINSATDTTEFSRDIFSSIASTAFLFLPW